MSNSETSHDNDNDPVSLKTPKPVTTKMRPWPIYAAVVVVLVLFGVLFYSVNYSNNAKKTAENKQAEKPQEKPLASVEGHGLSLQPPPHTTGIIQATPPPGEVRDATKTPLVVVRDDRTGKEDEIRRTQEIKRNKDQAYMSALSSPLISKKVANSVSDKRKEHDQTPAPQQSNSQQIDSSATMMSEADTTAADRDKEKFFDRSAVGRDEWMSPHSREAGLPYEVKTGTVIPCIMESGINSDLPGHLIARVAQNVYDTATGHNLLFPQGSSVFGVYDSRVVYGQSRVLIAWNRLNFPDGTSVTLGAMPGADMSGYAGFNDKVDNHYVRIFGSALLMSMITGGTSYAMDEVSNNDEYSNKTTVQDAMASALAAQMGQTTMSLLQKNLNIKPTLEIRPGYQFNVIVTKDIVFKEPYAPHGR